MLNITKYWWKETKKHLNNWRDIQCSWIRILNTVNISIIPKLIYIFNATLIKFLAALFFFFHQHKACRTLVPQPGIEPTPPAVEAQSLNHWTSRKVPQQHFKNTDCVRVRVIAQWGLTLCDPMDCNPPVSSLSMGFARQEYWSGLPSPSPGDLPDPGLNPDLLCLLHCRWIPLSCHRSPQTWISSKDFAQQRKP